jgi:23S rRNA (cytidine1920-2'-O)/16S rRNA (cytidine1409-2'-O)-methyltransferase
MKIKKRLDQYIQELHPEWSKTQIQSWIMQGKASVNGVVITKSGTSVSEKDEITILVEQPKYVCRAGWKLEHALDTFGIEVTGLTILDAGLSTGGFTDCLLQHGAAKIYGVDVGWGQVHEKIRANPQVIVRERTNLRYLNRIELGEQVDLITLDLSFISLLKVMDAVHDILKPTGQLITLIKPQFEAERHEVERGGLITNPVVHKRVIDTVTQKITQYGFTLIGVIDSPILGTEGNKEFLAYFRRS